MSPQAAGRSGICQTPTRPWYLEQLDQDRARAHAGNHEAAETEGDPSLESRKATGETRGLPGQSGLDALVQLDEAEVRAFFLFDQPEVDSRFHLDEAGIHVAFEGFEAAVDLQEASVDLREAAVETGLQSRFHLVQIVPDGQCCCHESRKRRRLRLGLLLAEASLAQLPGILKRMECDPHGVVFSMRYLSRAAARGSMAADA